MKKIFILGSLNTDMVISTPRMPKGGETISGDGFMINEGGKGANQAAACGKLGGKIFMSGCLGDDIFGDKSIKNLASYGVDVTNIRRVENCSSGVAVIVLSDGDNRIILDKGANAYTDCSDADSLFSKAKEGDIFLTQLEIDYDVVGYALKKAKELGMYTILNPAPANKYIEKYFDYVDLITPNESELKLFTGEDDYIKGAEKLNVPEVIVTLGGDGYYYKGKENSIKGKCVKIKPVDTTAAGDTFCGALAVRLASGEVMEKSLEFASRAATLACLKKGAQQSVHTLGEVEEFMNR